MNADRTVKEWKKSYWRLKRIIFDHYGRECACCGESIIAFLTIDHKNNDGAKHRKLCKSKGGNTYTVMKSIVDSGFPDDIQILCFNCNNGRFINGGICPHMEKT